jgi:AraC family transcriptional regulator of adaptative response/methylated-DNA-[protein]-cysteine methyltransferase
MTAAMKAQLAAATVADPRWDSVVARNPSADGSFVYSVSTTGVYCRPSCGARLARPEHVQFHAGGADAAAAGFRPCRRCRPDEAPLAEQHAAIVTEACRSIEAADRILSLEELAGPAGLSPFHFHRVFRAITGVTPRAYALARRGERVRKALTGRGTVTRAIYESGYGSSGRFYAESRQLLGMNPTVYRDGGPDAAIRFAVGQCSLGAILVARSGLGICAILLGDDPAQLVHDLEDRFPRAELIGGDAEFESVVAAVVGFVEHPAVGLDLPLDVRGTAFQQRVWQALLQVPAGERVSYAEIAARIGSPGAVRAVAQACGANGLAVAIPCHRVVRSDGGLSGYRWGVERKRALLAREAGA